MIGNTHIISVGDSRKGWVKAYQKLLEVAFYSLNNQIGERNVTINLSNIRPYGEVLNGFGGMANPDYIGTMFTNVANVLNQSVGRKLNSLEVMLILDEAAKNTVSGNIRRSAGMKQGINNDPYFTTAKDNLWIQDSDNNWSIDSARDALRMSNHTTLYHIIPSLEIIKESITKQYYSGEGAIMYVPEAIARANADLLNNREKKDYFVSKYLESKENGRNFLYILMRNQNNGGVDPNELEHRLNRFGLNPCAEVIGNNFRCNLGTVHLSQVGVSVAEQSESFKAAALQVVPLLKLDVDIERFQHSHSVDPIVLVSATQVNEWFINYFGTDWVNWWMEGRPDSKQGIEYRQEEASILNFWRKTIQKTIQDYCVKHDLRIPNRYSGFKPEGSLSWLSGSPGFSGVHFPPSGGLIYIRRKTFLRDDPVALAAIDYGYKVIAGTDCKNENGQLFDNPYDPHVKTWLLEIPVKETILDKYSELVNVNFNQISALAQFDWLLQLQQNYSTHNTSYTLNFRKNEIDDLSNAVHDAIINNKGYVSMALLARSDESQTFPRMPFESITLDEYNKQITEIQVRRKADSFEGLIKQKLNYFPDLTTGEVACSSEICEIR
jgi:ribonucleotide reductase class II